MLKILKFKNKMETWFFGSYGVCFYKRSAGSKARERNTGQISIGPAAVVHASVWLGLGHSSYCLKRRGEAGLVGLVPYGAYLASGLLHAHGALPQRDINNN